MRDFVDQVYVPDTLAIAGFYKDWFKQGEGLGNFMTFGDLPAKGMDDPASFFPRGAILNRDLSNVDEVDLDADDQVQEFVAIPGTTTPAARRRACTPTRARRNSTTAAPSRPTSSCDVEQAYSWLKSPRWKGKAMEVGPLARVLMLYATGHAQTKELVGQRAEAARPAAAGAVLDARPHGGAHAGDQAHRRRHAGLARPADGQHQGRRRRHLQRVAVGALTWPKSAQGVGFMEAPRGGLAHWIVIEDEKIANYQCVVPSTWNAGPRDPARPARRLRSRAAGHAMHDPKQPLEDPAHHPQLRPVHRLRGAPNSAQGMRWGIKRVSNDELRQKFVDATVPQARVLGVTLPDPDLKWNEERQHHDYGRIDWDEFWATVNGNGPCNKERLATRVKAHNNGQWVRDAALAYARKQQERSRRDAA
jgi:hypothetical protein